jgi:hypothetical protein
MDVNMKDFSPFMLIAFCFSTLILATGCSEKPSTKNLSDHTLFSNTSLSPKDGSRIEIHVSNEDLTREQCKNIINAYRKKAGPEGQVSVRKPSSVLDNKLTPWCVDNIGMDDRGIFFNDGHFKKTEQIPVVKKSTETENVVSNKFELSHNKTKLGIGLMLDTDLPKDTIISVTASRSYWEKNNETEYSRDYYEFKGKLSEFDDNSSVDLDPSKWRNNLKSHQSKMKKAGLGFDIDNISDEVIIRAIVPINGQTNPLLGDRNSNLSGNAVLIKSYGRLIEHEIKIAMPL